MRKVPVRVYAFFLFLIAAAFNPGAFRLEAGSRRYIVTAWGIEDGLPQNSVLNLVQGREGYIWFGTQSGLVRFDGVAARIYNRWNSDGLKNDWILALYEDKNGTLWVGTAGGGISRLESGTWTTYTTANGLSSNTVRAIAGDGTNKPGPGLWIGTDSGLDRLEKGKIKNCTMADGFPGGPVTALAAGGGTTTMWIGTGNSGLFRMKNGKFQAVSLGKSLRLPAGEITALYEDRPGRLWIGTENGLYYLEQEKIQESGPAGISVKSIIEDSGGSPWIGTEGEGVYCLKDGVFTPLNTSRGLPDDFIYSLLEDHEGNLWLGTYTNGLVRLKTAAVGSITAENGLPGNRVQTVLQDDDGYWWVGTDRKGVSKIKITGDTVVVLQTFTAGNGLTGNRVNSLYQDREKNLWVGTSGGLNRIKDGKIRVYTTGDRLSANPVTSIFQDRPGALWIGTTAGLNRLAGGKLIVFAKHLHIRTIGEDRQGNLRVGTVTGIFLLRGGEIRPFDPGYGYDVLALYEDSSGDLWAGTNGSGLIRFKESSPARRTIFTGADGLPGNYIFSIHEDSSGNLWMSSYLGVFRIAKKELAGGNPGTITAAVFDEQEGMRSRECVMGGQPAAWKTPDGKFFFPTVKGIAVFDPRAIRPNSKPPPVIIEEVIADNQPLVNAAGQRKRLALPVGTRVIEFYFTALSFTAPGKVRFRYMLEGFDGRWLETAPRQKRAVFYLNLPPGNYRFKVTACNDAGVWNDSGARFEFEIKAPFYKRPVFYIAILLGLLVIAAGLSRLFYGKREKRRQAAAQEEKEKEKTAEKYKTSALLPETTAAVLPKLTRLMEEEKLFLEPDLTLNKLAQRLQVHYNHLSRIVNERLGKSFNDYINSYRIEEAKKKLVDPREAGKTVLEIAYETGFYSKSVFNTAFKKFTGMTPSRYRKGG